MWPITMCHKENLLSVETISVFCNEFCLWFKHHNISSCSQMKISLISEYFRSFVKLFYLVSQKTPRGNTYLHFMTSPSTQTRPRYGISESWFMHSFLRSLNRVLMRNRSCSLHLYETHRLISHIYDHVKSC